MTQPNANPTPSTGSLTAMVNHKRKQMQHSDSANDDDTKKMRLELARSTSTGGVRDPRLSRLQNEPQKSISLDPVLPTSSSSSDIANLLIQESKNQVIML